MTREEAIKILCEPGRIVCNVIKANDPDTCEYNAQSLEALQMAIEALSAEPCEDVAKERYEDLCEYFGEAKVVLASREEFKKWLERVKWHVRKADELARELKRRAEPCEDAISRQATVERLCKVAEFMNEKRKGLGSPYVMAALFIQDNKDEFPSVTPKQKMGHWKSTIDGKPICSECGFVSESEDGYFVSRYCPNCGAKMEASENG